MNRVDRFAGDWSRVLARRTSRRGFVVKLGTWLFGAAAAPLLLPVSRSPADSHEAGVDDPGDPTSCDYWRYCATQGFLCSCCGGSVNQCPPGTQMSYAAWIGTCQNPADGKHYLISYNDCCGKSSCSRCLCQRHEREMPVYRPAKSNNIHWCMANESTAVSCTVAIVLGVAEDES